MQADDRAQPRTVRPWGWYQTVSSGPGFLIKRIAVLPGQQISLQRHRHRAEHWLVVRGTARVTLGEQVLDLTVGQHCDVPLGTVHRLGNRGADEVEIVEIQLGPLLSEDDIERLQDDYGRVPLQPA